MTDVLERPGNGTKPKTESTLHIDSEDRASWLLRKLAALDAEEQRVKAQAEKILALVAAERENLMARFGEDLQVWVTEELQRQGGHSRTLCLLQGTIKLQHVPTHAELTDPAEALRFTQDSNLPCRFLFERLDANAYRELALRVYRTKGEVLPGVKIVPAEDRCVLAFDCDPVEGR